MYYCKSYIRIIQPSSDYDYKSLQIIDSRESRLKSITENILLSKLLILYIKEKIHISIFLYNTQNLLSEEKGLIIAFSFFLIEKDALSSSVMDLIQRATHKLKGFSQLLVTVSIECDFMLLRKNYSTVLS